MKNCRRFITIMLMVVTSTQSPALAVNNELETHKSLARTPSLAIEVRSGEYQSLAFDRAVPYRVFSPRSPQWQTAEKDTSGAGMAMVVYVMNLQGVPRPSKASDRSVIEGLLADGYLVAAVDFQDAKLTDHLSFQKDVNGLFLTFGGSSHLVHPWYYPNRKKLLDVGKLDPATYLEELPFSHDGKTMQLPIHHSRIYVVPSGYTVKVRHVFVEGLKAPHPRKIRRSNLFLDVIYPKPALGNDKVPLLLEGSSSGKGEAVVNANTPILYSWLFNGYAFASYPFIGFAREGDQFSQTRAVKYLRSRKDHYSLSGMVGTAGISKSSGRCYEESNYTDAQRVFTGDPHPSISGNVQVCMPTVGMLSRNDSWNRVSRDSPALVLGWHKLDGNIGPQLEHFRNIWQTYRAKGLGDRLLAFESLDADHEYDLYHLNELLAFFDRFCKPELN